MTKLLVISLIFAGQLLIAQNEESYWDIGKRKVAEYREGLESPMNRDIDVEGAWRRAREYGSQAYEHAAPYITMGMEAGRRGVETAQEYTGKAREVVTPYLREGAEKAGVAFQTGREYAQRAREAAAPYVTAGVEQGRQAIQAGRAYMGQRFSDIKQRFIPENDITYAP